MALNKVDFNFTFVSFLTRLPKCESISGSGEAISFGVNFKAVLMPFLICLEVRLNSFLRQLSIGNQARPSNCDTAGLKLDMFSFGIRFLYVLSSLLMIGCKGFRNITSPSLSCMMFKTILLLRNLG